MKRFVFLTSVKKRNIIRLIRCKMFNTKDVYVHDYKQVKIIFEIMKLSVKNK